MSDYRDRIERGCNPLNNRPDLDRHQESILDHSMNIGPQEWLKKVHALVDTTDDMAAKDLIQFAGLFIMYKAIDKITQLEDLGE